MKKMKCSFFEERERLSLGKKQDFEIFIPDEDYEKLKEKAESQNIDVENLCEQEYFSVDRLPENWEVKPEKK